MGRWIVARREPLLLVLLLVVGGMLRLYGLNWDEGHWLHPDERQVYFITLNLGWPDSLTQTLSPDSPLNPQFFAYGSLPFYLLKAVGAILALIWPALRNSDNLHLAGRPLAVLCDLGTIYLTYRLVRKLYPASRGKLNTIALFAAALVGLAVVHVQLAHFYTVDPLLTFFVLLAMNLAVSVAQGGDWRWQIALGVALGLAMATKVSAIPLLFVTLVACNQGSAARAMASSSRTWRLVAMLCPLALSLFFAGIVFVLVQPYALIDRQTFLQDTIRESQIAWGTLDVPYTRQYAGTLPYLYSMWQTALWGLALPVGLLAWVSLAMLGLSWLRHGASSDSLLLAWAVPYFAITGLLYTRYLRYMLPLVPILSIAIALLLAELWQRGTATRRRVLKAGGWLLLVLSLVYSLVYVSIYAAPHTWISASEWLYRQVPAGSTLVMEDWDVALPLPLELDEQPRRIEEYDVRVLALYDEPDDLAKWEALASELADSDYAVLASRRLYGSIPRLPDRYPVATRYYELLFAGDLGFEPVNESTRGPVWLNPRIVPLPGAIPNLLRPDESFVVYDHPRALVFHNTERLSSDELLDRLDTR